jgi:nucleoside-diphosphate-sugar epimerase
MGRWVSKNLVDKGHRVWVLDNCSNCTEDNIGEFRGKIEDFIRGDIKDRALLARLFDKGFDICVHMAAAINVQESIDAPERCFDDNIRGTFNVLEECRKHGTKIVFISSALVYATAAEGQAITEDHPLNASCPYAASKISGENLTIYYYRTYGLPAVILRPFSIYGPWQKSDLEGGVMSIFIEKKLSRRPMEVFGDGRQGRDFFYVEDCAEFIVKAAFSDRSVGQVFNAGSGREVKIRDLAEKVAAGEVEVKFIKHHHQHAEIMSMKADSTKAREMLGWEPRTGLEEGMEKVAEWIGKRQRS